MAPVDDAVRHGHSVPGHAGERVYDFDRLNWVCFFGKFATKNSQTDPATRQAIAPFVRNLMVANCAVNVFVYYL